MTQDPCLRRGGSIPTARSWGGHRRSTRTAGHRSPVTAGVGEDMSAGLDSLCL